MAHWAELDENNKVIRVVVGDNNDSNGDEGYKWLMENLGGVWIQTSYNGKIRHTFAGVGFNYDPDLDIFYPPQCHEEAEFNKDTKKWICENLEHETLA